MHSISLARSRGRSRRVLLAAALPAALAAVALPAVAEANLLTLDRGVLTYQNQSVTGTKLEARVVNDQVRISSSTGINGRPTVCVRISSQEVDCPTDRVTFVQAFMGLKNDTVEYRLPHPGFVDLNDGEDTVHGGIRQPAGRVIEPVTYSGGLKRDTITYEKASGGIRLTPEDRLANDGRPGIDLENVRDDFESYVGSNFDDPQIFGTARADTLNGLRGDDALAGGGGDDLFATQPGDGRDDYHGGPHVFGDTISYETRTLGLTIDLDNVADDGETNERDNVRSNVENVIGGSGGDTIFSLGAFSKLEGRGGVDHLFGGAGPDTLIGGAGSDVLDAGAGVDDVQARDREFDTVDCGTETDKFSVDQGEKRVVNCP